MSDTSQANEGSSIDEARVNAVPAGTPWRRLGYLLPVLVFLIVGVGRAANMRGDHLKLSRRAERWEKQHGKIWCEERVRNKERREQGEFIRGNAHVARPLFEAVRDGTRSFNDNREAKQAATDLKADQRHKAAELASLGRAMHEHYRRELSKLGADYRRDKAMIGEEARAELAALKAENRAMIREKMRAFTRQQDQAQKTVAWRECSILGRVWNAVDSGRTAEGSSRPEGLSTPMGGAERGRSGSLAAVPENL